MEIDVVRPFNPIFYRRYVDDIYNQGHRERTTAAPPSPAPSFLLPT